jgi:S1-C subfamily serine protease
MMRLRWIAILTLCTTTPAVAQNQGADSPQGPTAVKSGIVLVIAQGVSTVLGNSAVAAQGTGFFTSVDGYLVTTHHLLDKLVKDQKADPRTVTFQVRFANGDSLDASPVNDLPTFDLLVLMAQLGERDVRILKPAFRSSAHIVPGTTKIFTAGFPAGYQFTVDQGIIKNWGPTGPVVEWATNLNLKDGQSGSPILLEDNRVIAFAKADDADAATIGLVVPVSVVPQNYWDALHDNSSASLAATISNSRTGMTPTVLVTTQEKPTASRIVHQSLAVDNTACAGPRTHTFQYMASPGWEIKPNTVNLVPTQSTGRTSASVSNLAGNAVGVTVVVGNVGQCVNILGKESFGDQPGRYLGVVSYEEVPTNGAPAHPVTVSEVAAAPNVSAPILTNRTADQLNFELKTVSGETVTFQPTANELKKTKDGLVLDTGKVLSRFESASAAQASAAPTP